MPDKNDDCRELTQKVLEYALTAYGVSADRPWEKYPENAVLRHGNSKKWFALIMPVERSRLGLPREGSVTVLNVKIDPLMSGSVRLEKGVLPAYHMNKNSWISVLLDGSVPWETVEFLLEISYKLTDVKIKPKKERKTK